MECIIHKPDWESIQLTLRGFIYKSFDHTKIIVQKPYETPVIFETRSRNQFIGEVNLNRVIAEYGGENPFIITLYDDDGTKINDVELVRALQIMKGK